MLAAIEPEQMMQGAVAVMVVLAVVAFLVMRFVQKLVLKLVVVAALVGAGVVLYTQRSSLDECQEKLRTPRLDVAVEDRCVCGFLGLDITVPKCADLLRDPTGA